MSKTLLDQVKDEAAKLDTEQVASGVSGAVINSITRYNGSIPTDAVTTAAIHSIDLKGRGLPLPKVNEQYGLILFTRPNLRLDQTNLLEHRTLNLLNTKDRVSWMAMVRAYLDPMGSDPTVPNNYHSPLVDPLNCFMPLLTNTCESLSGWPDPTLDTYTSRGGIYKEQWAMVDAKLENFETFSLNATFRNMVKDPITFMFYVWSLYSSLVREGVIDPYIDCIIENEKDYETRIYRLVLDSTREYVEKIACCGAAFPTSNSLGASFNYDFSKPYNVDTDSVQISFMAQGAMYYDPIVVWAFNTTVRNFNLNMADALRKETMQLLTGEEKVRFSSYPTYLRINPDTARLEVWMDKRVYRIANGR